MAKRMRQREHVAETHPTTAIPPESHRQVTGRNVAWLLVVPLLLSTLASFRLFEMDLFWALRAGEEIVSERSIPMTETWSYTVRGSDWLNTHWLTELTLHLVHRASGYAGLVVFRCVLVAIWLSLIALAAHRALGRRSLLMPSIFAAVAFVAGTYRMELRGEFFVLLSFTYVVVLWTGRAEKGREARAVAAVWVASQFHAGQSLMVLGLAVAMIGVTHMRDLRRLGPFLALAFAAFFATPVHVLALTFVSRHVLYSSNLGNPDHQPLTLKLFDVPRSSHGFAYYAFALISLIATVYLARQLLVRAPGHSGKDGPGAQLSGAYAHALPASAVLVVLVVLAIDRVRAVPFVVAYATPLGAALLTPLISIRNFRPVATGTLGFLLAVSVWQVGLLGRTHGLVVDSRVFPVGAAEFVARERPEKNLYHTFTFGAYLVHALPDYPVFGDTRETPFRSLSELYEQAYRSPVVTRALHEKYGIQTLMMPIPGTERLGESGFRDVIEEYTPRKDWALVYFDNISMVLVRRSSAHAHIVLAHEYHHLRPNIPPSFFGRIARKNPAVGAKLVAEAERCLARQPDTRHCREVLGFLRDALVAPG